MHIQNNHRSQFSIVSLDSAMNLVNGELGQDSSALVEFGDLTLCYLQLNLCTGINVAGKIALVFIG